ncbi:MAG: hypothetical protein MUF46_07965 [Desulfobacterales bacterium]|nr:hypothetical protein [Desulfobacterales bacterium]
MPLMRITATGAVMGMLILVALCFPAAADPLKGWGISDPYNKLYSYKEAERIKATVVKVVEVVPMPGMAPGVALEVREGGETIIVHLGPTAFLKPADIGIKPGDRVTIRGCWAEVNGKDVLMASKVKKGESFELKMRLTRDGTPFWTMTPEQLAKEQKSND